MAFMSSGSAFWPGSPLYFCTTMPSHRRTRFIDFSFGQTPTTQVTRSGYRRQRCTEIIAVFPQHDRAESRSEEAGVDATRDWQGRFSMFVTAGPKMYWHSGVQSGFSILIY